MRFAMLSSQNGDYSKSNDSSLPHMSDEMLNALFNLYMPNMLSKTLEALIIGVVIWVVGASMIVVFGDATFFSLAVIPTAFLVAPLMYVITKFHLRDILTAERTQAAMRLGIIVTGTQFPLDALGWLMIFHLGYPPLSEAAREMIILALEIGYFWLLIVPLWTEKRT